MRSDSWIQVSSRGRVSSQSAPRAKPLQLESTLGGNSARGEITTWVTECEHYTSLPDKVCCCTGRLLQLPVPLPLVAVVNYVLRATGSELVHSYSLLVFFVLSVNSVLLNSA